ncbi:MAG: hypothetical protein MUC59_19360 [Saprospiraceae bacterium]|jgi:hypothetical protein|nr:hypothetical protein [Saprospiraceae bacterium]
MKILALILCIANLGMAAVSGMMAMFSPMAMDAPGSEKSKLLWAFVYLMMASPVAFIVTDVLAWVQFGKGNYGAAIRWALIGFLPFVLAFLSLFLAGK